MQRGNYDVSIPVIIEGPLEGGFTYKYKSHIDIEQLGLKPKSLPIDMSSPKRLALVKEMVKAELPDGGLFTDDLILYEGYDDTEGIEYWSDETWTLDPTGTWFIEEEINNHCHILETPYCTYSGTIAPRYL